MEVLPSDEKGGLLYPATWMSLEGAVLGGGSQTRRRSVPAHSCDGQKGSARRVSALDGAWLWEGGRGWGEAGRTSGATGVLPLALAVTTQR